MPVVKVVFFSSENGGRFNPPMSGFRPQVDLSGVHTSCLIESLEGLGAFAFNVEHIVRLTLMHPGQYKITFELGHKIELFEGGK